MKCVELSTLAVSSSAMVLNILHDVFYQIAPVVVKHGTPLASAVAAAFVRAWSVEIARLLELIETPSFLTGKGFPGGLVHSINCFPRTSCYIPGTCSAASG
jgi:hypothetical protein